MPQELYEQIRPFILFGQTPGERAKEIGAAQRTLSRTAAVGDFDLHSDVDFIIVMEEELSPLEVPVYRKHTSVSWPSLFLRQTVE